MIRCPNCNVLVGTNRTNSDFLHHCIESTSNQAENKDSLPKLGTRTFDGVTTTDIDSINLQGMDNKATPSAKADGAKVFKKNIKGDRQSTHYLRDHYEYMEVKNA